jgi:NitT/TauT family transport system substrate-binding protein
MGKVLVTAVAALAIAACSATASAAPRSASGTEAKAPKLVNVLVQFTFKARGEYAHLFLAEKKGYYKKQGLNVTFQEGVGAGPVFASLAIKNGVTFVIAVMNQAAVAMNQGLPLRAVATWEPVVQSVLVSKPGVKISEPKDLIGKTVGLKQGQNAALVFPHFLKQYGIDPKLVTVKTLDSSSANAVFLQGGVDVVDAFITNEVPTLEALVAGRLNVLRFSDNGFPDLGIGVVVKRDLEKSSPNLIKKFLLASSQGIEAMKKDPQAAAEATKEKYGALLPDLPIVLEQVKYTITAMPQVGKHQYGWISPQEWTDAIATLKKTGVIVDPPDRGKLPISYFFTNKYLK